MLPDETIQKYKVVTPSFEGPLELLLSLIEEKKLFVNEISLAEVTNDYISFINKINHENMDRRIADISSFVIMAATLILIKSKSLLPNLNLTNDEVDKIDDLEKRLRLYSIIKNASIDIKLVFGTQIIFSAPERSWSDPIWSPDPKINLTTMSECIHNVINHIPKKSVPLPEIEIKKVMSIEEMMASLTDRIQATLNTSFSEFSRSHKTAGEKEAKVTVIVSFLAMLELVREGIINVMQNAHFEDIAMQNMQNSDLGALGIE